MSRKKLPNFLILKWVTRHPRATREQEIDKKDEIGQVRSTIAVGIASFKHRKRRGAPGKEIIHQCNQIAKIDIAVEVHIPTLKDGGRKDLLLVVYK